MKTEFDYGREYAESMAGEGEAVDVEEMVHMSTDIPTEDYISMKREGIENPDARKYWAGYNSYFD